MRSRKSTSVAATTAAPVAFYEPQWRGPIEGYVVNFISREFWRVERTQERNDLMQEAYLVYMRCVDKYPNMDTPQHFMALFKTCWFNHFTDLANADTARRVELPIVANRDENGDELPMRESAGELDNDGKLATLMRQAPKEVLLVLQLFLSAPQELLEMAVASWTPDSLRKTSGNAHINRMLGLAPDYDAVGAVREYFGVH